VIQRDGYLGKFVVLAETQRAFQIPCTDTPSFLDQSAYGSADHGDPNEK